MARPLRALLAVPMSRLAVAWGLGFLLLFPSLSFSESLTLAKTIEQALALNPRLKGAEESRREVAAGVREARAQALPSFKLLSGWDVSRNPSLLNSVDFEEFVESFPGGSFEPRRQTLYNLSAEVAQPLFTWGKVGAALELARSAGDVAESRIDTLRLDIAAEAAEAYFALARSSQALEALEAQHRARTEAFEVVHTRYELGDATRLELLRSKAALAAVEPARAVKAGEIESARSRLRRILGMTRNTQIQLELPKAAVPSPPPLAALLGGTAKRPEELELLRQEEALSHRIRVLKADGKPQLDFSGAYGRVVRRPEDLEDPLFRDWRISVDFTWDLFDGGRRRGQVAQLESQMRQLAWQRQDLERQIAEEIAVAHSELAAARAREGAADVALEAAREANRVAQESYQEGVALQADVLAAQEQETQGALESIEARFDAFIQWVRLERSLGRIPALPADSPGAARAEEPEEAKP